MSLDSQNTFHPVYSTIHLILKNDPQGYYIQKTTVLKDSFIFICVGVLPPGTSVSVVQRGQRMTSDPLTRITDGGEPLCSF